MTKALLIAALALFSFSNAQETSFGVKGGLNLATLTGNGSNAGTRTSIHVGVLVEISITEKFKFGPELLYSTQGYKNSNSGLVVKEYYDYITLPLMAKFYLTDKFSLEAGPQFSYLISAGRHDSFNFKSDPVGGNPRDYLDGSTDYGVNLGIGYKFSPQWFLQARYYMGLRNIYDTEMSELKIKNSVIQFSVGYYIF